MVFVKKKSMSQSQKIGVNGINTKPYINKFKKNLHIKRKICKFCADKIVVDYKNISLLRTFMTEKGKIFSSRITGTCTKHQRKLTIAIKRARVLALLPFTNN